MWPISAHACNISGRSDGRFEKLAFQVLRKTYYLLRIRAQLISLNAYMYCNVCNIKCVHLFYSRQFDCYSVC